MPPNELPKRKKGGTLASRQALLHRQALPPACQAEDRAMCLPHLLHMMRLCYLPMCVVNMQPLPPCHPTMSLARWQMASCYTAWTPKYSTIRPGNEAPCPPLAACSLVHIENWAVDLAWDIIARFGQDPSYHLPRAFFDDFVTVSTQITTRKQLGPCLLDTAWLCL